MLKPCYFHQQPHPSSHLFFSPLASGLELLNYKIAEEEGGLGSIGVFWTIEEKKYLGNNLGDSVILKCGDLYLNKKGGEMSLLRRNCGGNLAKRSCKYYRLSNELRTVLCSKAGLRYLWLKCAGVL